MIIKIIVFIIYLNNLLDNNCMKVKVINESGYNEAMLGLSLSYKIDISKMNELAKKLASKNTGENKFLESIIVWLDITAPRYFWSQFDTYRVGITKQSESTMHTLIRKPLTKDDFEYVDESIIDIINEHIKNKDLLKAKSNLPESFLQRRIVCLSYKSLLHIFQQRKSHKLSEWLVFINVIKNTLKHQEFIKE